MFMCNWTIILTNIYFYSETSSHITTIRALRAHIETFIEGSNRFQLNIHCFCTCSDTPIWASGDLRTIRFTLHELDKTSKLTEGKRSWLHTAWVFVFQFCKVFIFFFRNSNTFSKSFLHASNLLVMSLGAGWVGKGALKDPVFEESCQATHPKI